MTSDCPSPLFYFRSSFEIQTLWLVHLYFSSVLHQISLFTFSSYQPLAKMRFTTAVALATLCLSTAVEAHSVITEVKGANGVNGVGMGVTDVKGKKPRLFNQVQTFIITYP